MYIWTRLILYINDKYTQALDVYSDLNNFLGMSFDQFQFQTLLMIVDFNRLYINVQAAQYVMETLRDATPLGFSDFGSLQFARNIFLMAHFLAKSDQLGHP